MHPACDLRACATIAVRLQFPPELARIGAPVRPALQEVWYVPVKVTRTWLRLRAFGKGFGIRDGTRGGPTDVKVVGNVTNWDPRRGSGTCLRVALIASHAARLAGEHSVGRGVAQRACHLLLARGAQVGECTGWQTAPVTVHAIEQAF